MKTYRGARTFDGIEVTVDDRPLPAAREVHTFSLNGFEWGYEGPESTQLALAILADAASAAVAKAQAEAFMRAIVANFDNEWEITDEQVLTAVRELRAIKHS